MNYIRSVESSIEVRENLHADVIVHVWSDCPRVEIVRVYWMDEDISNNISASMANEINSMAEYYWRESQ